MATGRGQRPANWNETQQPGIVAASVILLILTNVSVALRAFLQIKTQKKLFADDWVILFGLFMSNGLLSINFVAIHAGLGLHDSRVLAQDPHPPNRFIVQAKVGWVNSVLMGPMLFTVKLALLLFFRRIFWAKRSFKIAWWINMVYAILLTIATTIIFICQVLPISFFWDSQYLVNNIPPPHPIPTHATVIANRVPGTGVPSVVSDIAILLLPVLGLYEVRMSRSKKMSLLVLFCIGLFACACGVVKIVVSYTASTSKDFSWTTPPLLLWACCEESLGIFCASLPIIAGDLKLLHSKRDYLTSMWPPNPPRVFNRSKNNRDVYTSWGSSFTEFEKTDLNDESSPKNAAGFDDADKNLADKRRRSSYWSVLSITSAFGWLSGRNRDREPSLESDFEWVTPPRHSRAVVTADMISAPVARDGYRVDGQDGFAEEQYNFALPTAPFSAAHVSSSFKPGRSSARFSQSSPYLPTHGHIQSQWYGCSNSSSTELEADEDAEELDWNIDLDGNNETGEYYADVPSSSSYRDSQAQQQLQLQQQRRHFVTRYNSGNENTARRSGHGRHYDHAQMMRQML